MLHVPHDLSPLSFSFIDTPSSLVFLTFSLTFHGQIWNAHQTGGQKATHQLQTRLYSHCVIATLSCLVSSSFPRLALMRKNLHKQINKQTFYPNWRSPASLLLAPALFGFSATQPLLLSGPQLVIQCQVGLTGMQCQWQGQGQPKLGVTSAKSGAKTESTNQINHDYRMIFTAVTQACGCTVQK